MDLANIMNYEKKKISDYVYNELQNTNIPAGLMCYILESVLLDIKDIHMMDTANSMNSIENECKEYEKRLKDNIEQQEEGEVNG